MQTVNFNYWLTKLVFAFNDAAYQVSISQEVEFPSGFANSVSAVQFQLNTLCRHKFNIPKFVGPYLSCWTGQKWPEVPILKFQPGVNVVEN